MFWGQTISISISPNTEKEDVIASIFQFLKFHTWKQEGEIRLQNWFEKQFPSYEVFLFNSGRSSLYELLKSFGVGKNDEVIVQAFTCVSAVEPILWLDARPVYSDIDESRYSSSAVTIEKKITSRTKAIIVQHTFGIPADIENIVKIAKKKHIIVIEDCAHSLGGSINTALLGSFGDASFFSFGRDKIVSSVFGGAALIKKSNIHAIRSIKRSLRNLPYPSRVWIARQLLHPIILHPASVLYSYLHIGRFIIAFARQVNIISLPNQNCELSAVKPSVYPKKYPNALASLIMVQLSKVTRYNNHRIRCARIYGRVVDDALYLRYPLLVKNPKMIIEIFKKNNILIGSWYSHIIDPKGVAFTKLRYKIGSCPVAEDTARHCINLPTHPRLTIDQAIRIHSLLHSVSIPYD